MTMAGLDHWGTWICDCNVLMIGNITLAPAGDFNFQQPAAEVRALGNGRRTGLRRK